MGAEPSFCGGAAGLKDGCYRLASCCRGAGAQRVQARFVARSYHADGDQLAGFSSLFSAFKPKMHRDEPAAPAGTSPSVFASPYFPVRRSRRRGPGRRRSRSPVTFTGPQL